MGGWGGGRGREGKRGVEGRGPLSEVKSKDWKANFLRTGSQMEKKNKSGKTEGRRGGRHKIADKYGARR